jgi:hypothetical protein
MLKNNNVNFLKAGFVILDPMGCPGATSIPTSIGESPKLLDGAGFRPVKKNHIYGKIFCRWWWVYIKRQGATKGALVCVNRACAL